MEADLLNTVVELSKHKCSAFSTWLRCRRPDDPAAGLWRKGCEASGLWPFKMRIGEIHFSLEDVLNELWSVEC